MQASMDCAQAHTGGSTLLGWEMVHNIKCFRALTRENKWEALITWLCRTEKVNTILKLPPKRDQEEWCGHIHKKGLRDPQTA